MEIKIPFDSISLDKRFLTGWGVSYLIDKRILFDTGEKDLKIELNPMAAD
ncbi:MAG: hypothetical protein QME40_04755 [bacterium]|nr:hypothetical protein [bacterium]